MRLLRLSLLALAVLLSSVAPALGADTEASWYELPSLLPVELGKVQLERVTIDVVAAATGDVTATSVYTLANASARRAEVRVALPVSMPGRHPFEERALRLSCRGTAAPELSLDGAPVALGDVAALPGGRGAQGHVVTVTLDRYAAAKLQLVVRVPWNAIEPPLHLPAERGLSVSFDSLATWGDGLEGVEVVVAGEPRLLGPATYAEPMGYDYDTRALRWQFARQADDTLPVPARIAVAVLAGWETRHFDGVYFARFTATDDDYPWPRRFHHVRPISKGAGGKPAIVRDHVDAVLKALQEMELVILARNGKHFDDTFSQMRFQKESWYKPDRAFSEDRIRPVESWNLDYARCQARACRTVLSALDKMGAAEVGAGERKARMLLAAFERCDKRFWSPRPRRTEKPRLQ